MSFSDVWLSPVSIGTTERFPWKIILVAGLWKGPRREVVNEDRTTSYLQTSRKVVWSRDMEMDSRDIFWIRIASPCWEDGYILLCVHHIHFECTKVRKLLKCVRHVIQWIDPPRLQINIKVLGENTSSGLWAISAWDGILALTLSNWLDVRHVPLSLWASLVSQMEELAEMTYLQGCLLLSHSVSQALVTEASSRGLSHAESPLKQRLFWGWPGSVSPVIAVTSQGPCSGVGAQ